VKTADAEDPNAVDAGDEGMAISNGTIAKLHIFE
jgi:hypothetical protein